MTIERPIPTNTEAEQATLGSVLMNREALAAIAPWLAPGHFWLEQHAWIYAAMLACYAARVPPDTRTVSDELRRRGQLEQAGGVAYLSELVDATPTSYHVESYARIVERTAVRRGLIVCGGKIAALGYDEALDLDETEANAQALLTAALTRPGTSSLVPFSQIAGAVYDTYTASDESPGIPTTYRDLDELLIGGFHRQDLIILAARPSVGKSALAGCIAGHVGASHGPVLVFSLEMSAEQWFARLAAGMSGVNLAAIRGRWLSDRQLQPFVDAINEASRLPIYVNDEAAQTVAAIRSVVLRHIASHGAPSLIVVDYLQLMTDPRRTDNRVLEVGAISRGLKQLARETDAPVLAISQLSRAVEGRQSHVPMLSDLRESGALEQDADVVMFLYRPELYGKESDKKGIAEVHIAKHRNGPLGVVPMRFEASTTSFQDLTYRTDPPPPARRPYVDDDDWLPDAA
jgi:replicative DNA helicase